MKKSTGSILLLSAFAALVLAGCGNDTKDSSSPTGSSDTAVQTSADETSPAGTSEAGTSATGTSAAGTSTASSSATASSSSAASSSSTPAVETDWSGKKFIGEYKGGMSNLIINADKTTSWGTSTDKFPATYTELSTGVWMIKSAATVADEDYVEVITDGTMAYVMHDKEAYDYYVMDKNALGSAVIAFAETEDEEKFFGGIEVTANHWKYFACISGTYTFGATITMQAGTNINAGGAIFDFGTGTSKSSWKVTTAAPAATAFAKIEQTNFEAKTYTGEHGELVIGTDDDGLVFAKINGVVLNDATLSDDGGVLSVPNGSAATTYDMKNPAGPSKVVPTTTYTLAKIAMTYTEGEGTTLLPLFDHETADSGTYSAETGADGHIWIWFTPSADGKITITEDQGTSYTDYYGDPEDYMVIYDAATTADSAYAGYTGGMDYEYTDYYGDLELSDIVLEGGHHYVIRVGSGSDNYKDWKSTGSSYSGETVEISWVFTPYVLETYTGDLGDLVIQKDGTETIAVKLNGTKVDSYVIDDNAHTVTTSVSTLDITNPANPAYNTVTTTITIDPATSTYTSTATPTTTYPFHALSETDTSYSDVTGDDGNIWMTFTPTKSGQMTVTETTMGVDDSLLQIFEYDPSLGLDGLRSTNKKRLCYVDYAPITFTTTVKAGVTYVIKLGAWHSRDLVLENSTYSDDIGCVEAISFKFVDYLAETFTGSDGDLVISSKDGVLKSVSLGGANMDGNFAYDSEAGTLVIKGEDLIDTTNPDDPTATRTIDTFVLDYLNETYVRTTQTVTESIIHVLTDSSTGLSGNLGPDGSLWASFTPTVDGYLSIDETVQGTNGTSVDTSLLIYKKTASSTLASYKGTSGALNYSFQYAGWDNSNNPVYVHFMPVTAGETYIIKIGAYGGANNCTIGDTLGSTYTGFIGAPEAFTFSFGALESATYTADGQPDLNLQTVNGQVYKATLGTKDVTKSATLEDGKTLRVSSAVPTYNTSNKLDPIATYNDTLYFLDNEGLTYEIGSESTEVHLFQTVNPTDTSITGTVGSDGNLWGVFTAPADGYVTIEETKHTTSDSYLQWFESTASEFTSANAKNKDDSSAALSGAGKLVDLPVEQGKTYVIKGGAWSDRDKVPGGSGTSTYAGNTETISFIFEAETETVYTGAEGDLVQKFVGETYKGVTLNGETFTATPNDDHSVYTLKTGAFEDGTFNKITKTYTLGEGQYDISTEHEATTATLSDEWTGDASGTYATLDNGSVIIAFTPETSGQYTFKLDKIAGLDTKIGLYADKFDAAGFSGSALAYKDETTSSTRDEQFTYNCEAGKTYYIKASAYYSDFVKSILTAAESSRIGVDLTITVAAA